jgi:hypothetical protein
MGDMGTEGECVMCQHFEEQTGIVQGPTLTVSEGRVVVDFNTTTLPLREAVDEAIEILALLPDRPKFRKYLGIRNA